MGKNALKSTHTAGRGSEYEVGAMYFMQLLNLRLNINSQRSMNTSFVPHEENELLGMKDQVRNERKGIVLRGRFQ